MNGAADPRGSRTARRAAACWGALGLMAWLVVGPAAARAQDRPPELVDLRVGFEGRFRLGLFTPVELTLRGGTRTVTGRLYVTVLDGDGGLCRTPVARPIQLFPGQDATATTYARFGRMNGSLRVELLDEQNRVVFERTVDDGTPGLRPRLPIESTARVVLQVGPAIGLEQFVRDTQPDARTPFELIETSDVARLPRHWFGYEGIETLVLSTSRPELFTALDPAQVEAIRRWVQMGGRLLIVAGEEATHPAILAANAPLVPLAPGPVEQVVTLSTTQALEDYADAETRIARATVERNPLRVARVARPRGVVELAEGDLPLVIRMPLGLGDVTFVAVDLDRQPLSTWEGRRPILARVLSRPKAGLGGPYDLPADPAVQNAFGYVDLAGQLRGALDEFAGVTVVPFSVVALAVFGYILLIGPGDYLLVRYGLKRMELTWLTFPAIVLAVSLAAYLTAYALKGTQLRLNQVDVVDVDAEGGFVRGTTWFSLFSPIASTYHLSVRPGALPLAGVGGAAGTPPQADSLTTWFGLPGGGMGGMDTWSGELNLFARHYAASADLGTLDGVPIAHWSSRSFTSRWSFPARVPPQPDLKAADDIQLEGRVENPLAVPLEQAVLLHGNWAYELGTLAPGGSAAIESSRRRDAEFLLKAYRVEAQTRGPSYTQVDSAYTSHSLDVSTIVTKLLFDEATGPAPSGPILNRYQGFVDASRQLRIGRAVLLGSVTPSASTPRPAEVLRDGQPLAAERERRWVVYRFFYPVRRGTDAAPPTKASPP